MKYTIRLDVEVDIDVQYINQIDQYFRNATVDIRYDGLDNHIRQSVVVDAINLWGWDWSDNAEVENQGTQKE